MLPGSPTVLWCFAAIAALASCSDSDPATPDAAPDAAPADASAICTDTELAALEAEIAAAFDAAAVNPAITDDPNATLLIASDDGRTFTHAHGASSATTVYESASTSKWVTAAVLLDLVDQGELSLTTTTSELLSFWTAPGVSLASLLSFTSGFDDEDNCMNRPGVDFATCVELTYQASVGDATAPGAVYQYSGSHMQIAGLMAMRATGAASWSAIFAAWQARTGLFPTGAYDLPSRTNPRLAGGMHWTGAEYLEFLRALRRGDLLTETTRAAMLRNQRGTATLTTSPAIASWGEDWAYGFGNWLECSTATATPGSYDCGDAGERNSSAGAYGAYPVLDAEHGYVGVVARQGALGSGEEGVGLFRAVDDLVARWATRACP